MDIAQKKKTKEEERNRALFALFYFCLYRSQGLPRLSPPKRFSRTNPDGEMPCFGRFDDDLYFSLTQHRLGSLLLILNKRFLHLLTLFDNGYLSFAG